MPVSVATPFRSNRWLTLPEQVASVDGYLIHRAHEDGLEVALPVTEFQPHFPPIVTHSNIQRPIFFLTTSEGSRVASPRASVPEENRSAADNYHVSLGAFAGATEALGAVFRDTPRQSGL